MLVCLDYDGVIVDSLAQQHHLCIVTSNLQGAVTKVLGDGGLGDLVSLILDGNEPGSKADKIVRAAKHFKTTMTETCMVGDTRIDIKEGKRAGSRTVAVGWGYQSGMVLKEEQPDFFVEKPEDLPAVLA